MGLPFSRRSEQKPIAIESKEALIQRQKVEVSAQLSRLSQTLSDQVIFFFKSCVGELFFSCADCITSLLNQWLAILIQALISRLPDKGSNLKKKQDDLKNQLKNLEYLSVLEREGAAPSAPIVIKEESYELEEVSSFLAGLKMQVTMCLERERATLPCYPPLRVALQSLHISCARFFL